MARSIFLFGRDCIFPPRPYELATHGAEEQVKVGAVAPPGGLDLDRSSTVLRLDKAMAIIGRHLIAYPFLRQRSQPAWAETRASRAAGLGCAANVRRAIERGPSPEGEEPPKC